MHMIKVVGGVILIGIVLTFPQGALASWPGHNGKIAFTREGGSDVDIFSISRRGHSKSRLTDSKREDGLPSFSPDGRHILFTHNQRTRHATDNFEIYRMDADGSHEKRLTRSAAIEFSPSYSPNGKRIVFSRRKAGSGWGVFKMDKDGSNVQRIKAFNARVDRPLWSPDGDRISYVTGDNLYTMNPHGSGEQLVSSVDDEVDWSPSGDKFVTRCSHAGHVKLCKFNEDGSGIQRVRVVGLRKLAEPRWSPNGRRILLTGQARIWTVKRDGTDKHALTRLPSSSLISVATWQPK